MDDDWVPRFCLFTVSLIIHIVVGVGFLHLMGGVGEEVLSCWKVFPNMLSLVSTYCLQTVTGVYILPTESWVGGCVVGRRSLTCCDWYILPNSEGRGG